MGWMAPGLHTSGLLRRSVGPPDVACRTVGHASCRLVSWGRVQRQFWLQLRMGGPLVEACDAMETFFVLEEVAMTAALRAELLRRELRVAADGASGHVDFTSVDDRAVIVCMNALSLSFAGCTAVSSNSGVRPE